MIWHDLTTPLTIRSLTFADSNDAATTLYLSRTVVGAAPKPFIFSSDTGNATLTVEAGSTGNKLVTSAIAGSTITLTSSLNIVHNGSGNLTIGGNAIFTGAGNITKSGTGTLILSSNNTYSGATTISAGTLQIGGAGLLGGGSYSANIAINGATSTFLYNSSSNQTLTGLISGNGVFTKNGSGMLSINASNTIGAKTVNGGTLRIVAAGNVGGIGASNSTVNLNNGSTLQLGGTTNSTSNNNAVYNGAVINIDSTGGATVANDTLNGLIQGGTGGWFTINTNGGAQSQLTSLNSGYWNNQGTGGGILFNVASGSNATADVLVSVGGTWGITKNGTGKVLITSSPNVNGLFAINGGTVEFGGSSAPTLTNTAYNITNNGTLSLNSTADVAISQNITGTGVITKSNTNTLTLSGVNNTYTGATTVTGGTLSLTGGLSGGTAISVGGNSVFTQGSASVISGTSSFTQNSTGTSTLAGANTYTGAPTINAGTLQITSGGQLGSGSYSQNISN